MDPARARKILVAASVALVCVLAYRLAKKSRREGFASDRAVGVFNAAKPLFDKANGAPPYSAYRIAVPDADPVQYEDLKALWKKGALTPDQVEKYL